jgi:hypothetical protein
MSGPGIGGDNCGMARPPTSHRRCLLAAAVLGLAAAAAVPAAPALAQQSKRPPATEPDTSLAGLPVYTADGKQIGTVIAMGLDEDDEPVLVAEIAQPLAIGPTAIAVPIDMFARKGNRIELTLTQAEVNARLKQ